MEITLAHRNYTVPNAGFERMKENIRQDLARQLFAKNHKDPKYPGHSLSTSREVPVA